MSTSSRHRCVRGCVGGDVRGWGQGWYSLMSIDVTGVWVYGWGVWWGVALCQLGGVRGGTVHSLTPTPLSCIPLPLLPQVRLLDGPHKGREVWQEYEDICKLHKQ